MGRVFIHSVWCFLFASIVLAAGDSVSPGEGLWIIPLPQGTSLEQAYTVFHSGALYRRGHLLDTVFAKVTGLRAIAGRLFIDDQGRLRVASADWQSDRTIDVSPHPGLVTAGATATQLIDLSEQGLVHYSVKSPTNSDTDRHPESDRSLDPLRRSEGYGFYLKFPLNAKRQPDYDRDPQIIHLEAQDADTQSTRPHRVRAVRGIVFVGEARQIMRPSLWAQMGSTNPKKGGDTEDPRQERFTIVSQVYGVTSDGQALMLNDGRGNIEATAIATPGYVLTDNATRIMVFGDMQNNGEIVKDGVTEASGLPNGANGLRPIDLIEGPLVLFPNPEGRPELRFMMRLETRGTTVVKALPVDIPMGDTDRVLDLLHHLGSVYVLVERNGDSDNPSYELYELPDNPQLSDLRNISAPDEKKVFAVASRKLDIRLSHLNPQSIATMQRPLGLESFPDRKRCARAIEKFRMPARRTNS